MSENSNNKRGFLGNALLGTAALAGTNYLTNGWVTDVMDNIATSASNVVSGAWSALGNTTPYFAWPLAPLATLWYSAYKWSQNYEKNGIIGFIESVGLNYGLIGWLGTAAGLMNAPLAGTALATWLGIWWTKRLFAAGKEFTDDPLGTFESVIKKPFVWTWNALAALRWGSGRATPST